MIKTRLKNYSKKVISGKIIAGRYFTLACERFIVDCDRKDIYFDEDFAAQCLELWEGICCYPKGALMGRPIVLVDFQKFLLFNLLCWRKTNGGRRYKTAYIQLARKSTKTFCMALVALAHLILDKFPAPYIPVGANDEQQAKICPDMVGKIIEKSPKLSSLINSRGQHSKPFTLYKYKDKYTQVNYNSDVKDGTMEAISSKASTKDGGEPTLGLVDEYHAAVDDSILEVIKTGQMMVEDRMLFVITTAGFNKEGTCYAVLRDQSVKNIEGIVKNDENFVLICEPDKGDDWRDVNTWRKSNPMMDDIPIIMQNLKHDFGDAMAKRGSTEVHFKTKNLNIWTNADAVWVGDEDWMKCKRDYTQEDFKDEVWFDGLDLAKGVDLNAYMRISSRMEVCPNCNGTLKEEKNGKTVDCIPCGMTGEQRHIYTFPFFWLPMNKAENHRDGVDYKKWEDMKLLNITPGNVVDVRYITNFIQESVSERKVKSLGYDRALSQHGVLQELIEQEIPIQEVIPTAFHLNIVTVELEEMIATQRIHHNGNPVMRWMLSNIILYQNPEGFAKFDKGKSKNKIDGWSALANAMHEAMAKGWEDTTNISSFIG